MRVTTLASAIGAAAIPVLVGFAGCGGSVTNASAGSAGTGGKTSTASTGTSSSAGPASTTGPSASSATTGAGGMVGTGGVSGTGGAPEDAGSPCQQACAHAAMCGIDVCTMFNLNCATIPANYDCLLTCLDGVPCAQFGFAAVQACNAQCAGGDGGTEGGPPPFDAGPGGTCAQCLTGSCQQQSLACAGDMGAGGCFGWIECEAACYMASPVQASCFTACDAMFPNAATLYGAVNACACANCASQCTDSDPCANMGDGGDGG